MVFFRAPFKQCSKVNLGGGDFVKEGWCNLDLSTGYNVGRRLLRDLSDESVEAVYASHFMEHLPPEKVRVLLINVNRVLKKDGVVRISGPDLDLFTDRVLQGENRFLSFVDTFYERSAMNCDWLRWYLYMCGNPDKFGAPNRHPPTRHCWMVSANILIYFLIAAGFDPAKIEKSSFGGSRVPELRQPGFDNRKELSFFVEAFK